MFKKISGEVVHGEKLWRKLGFPTANIPYNQSDIDDSVFHINIIIDGTIYKGMWSHMIWKKIFEAHIFDFNEDIYGKIIEIILLKKVRDNKKFSSLDDLVNQIQQDEITIRNQNISVLTFGSFDVVHAWHEYYLLEARKYWDQLTTIVASDENIEKIKGRPPLHWLEERVTEVEKIAIAQTVLAGSNSNPMKWIKELCPDVICLWYDQRWPFVEKLQWEIEKVWLATRVARIAAFHPEKFKSSLLKNKRDTL